MSIGFIDKSSNQFPKVPTGSYPARVVSAEQVEGQYGPQIKWKFDLGEVETVDGEVEPVELLAWTSMKFVGGKKPSKLWQLASAAGLDCENSEGVDIENDIVGHPIRLTVVEEPARDGEGVFNRVTAFLPPSKAKSANGRQPQAVKAPF